MLAKVATDSEGFYLTQDLGKIEDSGRLVILGRTDRVLISGGIKVALDRVEQLAASVTGVEDVVACAVADQQWGERVGIAYVGSPEVADDVASAIAQELGPAGKPVRVLRVDRIPKTQNGKHDFAATKKLFES
jgi:O-succinylbenzoic acid--CoA ligase